ncbi:hypothetical protein ACXR8U_01480 [Methylobacterium radiotolerans]|uniref:hypothetical protein n=1 Tax=Methylobacterium TaxID=407 RepID=UPI0005E48AAA|nr:MULTISPECIES: hypothetical protein [Methylobacterium]MBN6818191.1 hypothetical protein [Methylobacterium organophilum]GAN46322.1 RNA-binding region RNP-1 domain-containing protein [Methylobacterium sp. ME121]
MKKLFMTLTAGAAVLGAASAAQAHEWGSGYGYEPGYGHSRVIVREGYRDGYRGVRFGHRDWDRPGVRVIERRGYGYGHHDGDWDD